MHLTSLPVRPAAALLRHIIHRPSIPRKISTAPAAAGRRKTHRTNHDLHIRYCRNNIASRGAEEGQEGRRQGEKGFCVEEKTTDFETETYFTASIGRRVPFGNILRVFFAHSFPPLLVSPCALLLLISVDLTRKEESPINTTLLPLKMAHFPSINRARSHEE